MPQFLKNWIRSHRHKKIIKTIEIPNQGSALDLSCSGGQFFKKVHVVKPDLKLFGIDVSNDDIEKAKRELPFTSFNLESAEKLSFQNETFDFAFSTMSLHHYENSQKVFKEIHRVLKTNGILYLTDLIPKHKLTQKLWNLYRCPEPYHFEAYYSISDLATILKPIGFSIVYNKKISLIPRVRILKLKKD